MLGANRTDFIRNGVIPVLLSVIEKTSLLAQSLGCLALARCLQDGKIIYCICCAQLNANI